MREEYERTVSSHAETLDQLTTAVAIFDGDEQLRFYNQAFQKLWDLDTAFLDSAPGQCADARPAARERQDRRAAGLAALEGERCSPPIGRSSRRSTGGTCPTARRCASSPTRSPQGGVTWVFENVTEQLDLESRYNTLIRVQGETLDHLAEGVAVFGPDGRLRLSNPAFGALWGLDGGRRQARSRISPPSRGLRAAAQRTALGGLRRRRHRLRRRAPATAAARPELTDGRCSTTPSSRCPTARRC